MSTRLRLLQVVGFLSVWLAAAPATAQSFTNVTSSANLNGITNTYGVDWGDYNNDGYPDLYVTGSDRLYRNNGNGTFSTGPSVSANDRAVHWGDMDNDGDMDIGATFNLYLSKNNGDGTFTQQSNSSIGITSINNLGDFAWLDYNGDGNLDLWAPNGSSPYAYMYQGNGDGTFSAIDADNLGISANTNGESTIVADYDADGYLDILYRASSVYLWHADGDGTYTNVTSSAGISLSGTSGGYDGTAFGDYDNDGDLDLYGGQNGYNKLYRNNGNGTFTDVTSSAGVAGPSKKTKGVAWGDYDNDGDLDLFVAHENGANNLFRNNNDGTFTDVASSYGLDISSNNYGAAWADYDLDGDLDLFIGRSSGGSRLYRNDTNNSNYLRVRVVGSGSCATNRAGIGVRVELYNAAGTTLLACRTIGTANGYGSGEPKWAHFGGVNNASTYTVKVHFLTGLTSTTVVPNGVATTIGGTVIAQMLTVEEAATGCLFTDVTGGAGLGGVDCDYGVAWADYNGDGHPDVYVSGANKLYTNNGNGTFSAGPSISSHTSNRRAAHWGDYDNDGDLDLGTTWDMYLNRNNGDNTFTRPSNSSLGLTYTYNLGDYAWMDYNGDGNLDIWAPLGSSPYAYMYSGNGGTFTAIDADNLGITANTNGETTIVADYDNDGYIDILYRGSSVYLWHADGDGTYTNVTSSAGISLSGYSGGYDGTAFGDYDNDGDLDLYGGQSGYNKLYRNNGNGTFTDVTASAGVAGPSLNTKGVAWGDYDNDGDLDLYVSQNNGTNQLYQNNNDGTFTDMAATHGVADASTGNGIAWEDFDNDGDLDLFAGNDSSASRLYRNNTDNADYLKVRVVGGGSCGTNTAAVGVRVDLYDAAGTTFLATRTIGTSTGYGSSKSMWAHFGGVNNATTYTVKVRFNAGWSSQTVVPASATTTIGATVIAQMLTVTEAASQVAYTDVSAATGFNVRSTTSYHSGSGLHWGDFDNDGDLDAIITGNSSARKLINNSAGQSFTVSIFGGGSRSRQGTLVDTDNDGNLDFYHCNEEMFEGDGAGGFSTRGNAGMSAASNNEGAAAADVNRDGLCDILLFSGNGNWIGHNNGGAPSTNFLVATNSSSYGLNDSGDKGNGDFCGSGDVNNDGYPDFFYNYGTGKLFLSDGDGTYTENASGISVVTGNYDKMGSAWGDYDNDGDIDLFVPRHDSGNTGYLWQNRLVEDGVVTFINVASSAGITDTSGQRSSCWGDYDNDGDLDLYLVTRSGNPNVLYKNQGDGTFVAACAGAEAPGDGHDAVFVDYDNDGDLDLAITQEDTDNTLLRNNTDSASYLKVRLVGRGSGATNLAAIGVRVDLWDAAGTTFLARREVGVARGYGGAEPLWLHFGGVAPATPYTVKVYFHSRANDEPYAVSVVPGAASTTIGAMVIPQMLTIEEPGAQKKILNWTEIVNKTP